MSKNSRPVGTFLCCLHLSVVPCCLSSMRKWLQVFGTEKVEFWLNGWHSRPRSERLGFKPWCVNSSLLMNTYFNT